MSSFHNCVAVLGLVAALAASQPATAQQVDLDKLDESVVRVVVPLEKNTVEEGTGFLINDQGYIVTNRHVVAHAKKEILVVLKDSLRAPLQAKLVFSDDDRDLAVIKVNPLDRTPLPLAAIEPRLGTSVYAFGYPGLGDRLTFAASATLTTGVVGRMFTAPWDKGGVPIRLIQHEAAVNPGNSGGPLVNACGQVLGINTQTSTSKVGRDENGEMQIVATAGVYFASHVGELIKLLRQRNIAFTLVSTPCVIAPPSVAAGTEDSWAVRGLYAWAAGLTVIVLGAVALMLRRPRQRIVQAVENVSRRIKTGMAPPQVATATAAAGILRPSRIVHPQAQTGPISTPSAAVGPAWILNGQDGEGKHFTARLSENSMGRLKYGLTVGRHDELCEVMINHPSLSRRHARFKLWGDRLAIEDLNSTNGTTLDGRALKPFEPEPVAPNAVLVLGDVRFTLSKA